MGLNVARASRYLNLKLKFPSLKIIINICLLCFKNVFSSSKHNTKYVDDGVLVLRREMISPFAT